MTSTSLIQTLQWQRHDTLWVLTLFGTAVGAGVLFLPIEAGLGGIWPLIVLALITIPIVYLSHKFLAYFVLSAQHETNDITVVARDHFGFKIGTLITLLYFLAIFPILLIYGVSLTNTVENFLVHQMNIATPSRALSSFLLTVIMMAVMYFGEKVMLIVTEILVFPLVFLLFLVSIYLIPHWNLSSVYFVPDTKNILKIILFNLPVLLFAFNHSPAISSFVLSQRKMYRNDAPQKVSGTLRITSIMLFLFVMFFVFSCVMALSPEALLEAKNSNISVMSYLANVFDNPLFVTIASLIAVVAIISSFFGHYLGAREGLQGLTQRLFESYNIGINQKLTNRAIEVFFFFSIWGISYLNPSILSLLEMFVGPIIAILLCIMPVIAIYRVNALKQYRNQFLNLGFVFVVGMLAVSVMVVTLIQRFL